MSQNFVESSMVENYVGLHTIDSNYLIPSFGTYGSNYNNFDMCSFNARGYAQTKSLAVTRSDNQRLKLEDGKRDFAEMSKQQRSQ